MRHIGDVTRGMGRPEERGASDPYAGGVISEHGWFSMDDIIEAGARFLYDRNGERVIQFPPFRDIPEHVVDQHEREVGR